MKKILFLSSWIVGLAICGAPVNSMLGADGIDINAEESLPYDSRVEYLEFTGTQFVDLGFSIEGCTSFSYSITAQFVDSSDLPSVYEPRVISNETQPYKTCDVYQERNGEIFIRPGLGRVDTTDTKKKFTAEYDGVQYWFLNEFGEVILTRSYLFTGSNNPSTFYLGCRRNNTSSTYRLRGRIYDAWFEVDGVQYHFIPVRIGDEGMFYETESGEFYGNGIGINDFIIGPDMSEGM